MFDPTGWMSQYPGAVTTGLHPRHDQIGEESYPVATAPDLIPISGLSAARSFHRLQQDVAHLLQVVRQLLSRIVVPLRGEDRVFVCAAVKFEFVSKSVCRRDIQTGFGPSVRIELGDRVADWF